jgi:hypothetical protein
VAFAAFRTPDIIDSLKAFNANLIRDMAKRVFADVEEVKERMRGKSDEQLTEEELEEDARAAVEYAQSDQYEITTSHTWAVKMAIQTALGIAPILSGRNWEIVHRYDEKKSFVTTDAPVLLTSLEPQSGFWAGVGFGSSNALILFPLTESCVLMMHGSDGDFRHLVSDMTQMRKINLALADHCQRFVIAREEALVRSLVKQTNLANRKWQPKMQRV